MKKSKFKSFVKVFAFLIFAIFLILSGIIFYLYNKYELDVNKLTSINNGIKVYSATAVDESLFNTNRSVVEIETLPEYVKNAFIATEDKRFYSHNGFDLVRILKAMFVNITTQNKTQGASTISQQLIKNSLLSNEKTYSRKIKEIILAIKMEKEFSKEEILEMYLNTIYFGSNAYGIENASKTYFNKPAKDLTLNEACCLAGIIKSPASYSPQKNIINSTNRKNLVANLMLKNGDITENEYQLVKNMDIKVADNCNFDYSYEEEAIFEACQLLNMTERELINKEYQIITFKDEQMQESVIKSNKDIIKKAENEHSASLDSLSVVAKNSGEVLAYYVNSNYDLHNVKRQAASTLKPLAVYLPCLLHNILSPSTKILDEKINYSGFQPKNADGKFNGYVSARYALAHSLNIPAVKMLDCLDVKKAKETLSNLGINISSSDLNLSLALGATKDGVKLTNLVSAYSTIANMGKYSKLCFVDKILDKENNVIYQHQDYSEQVVEAESCYLLTDMLKETVKTGTAKRLNSLDLNIASKTGTASNLTGNTDIYNLTYSSEHTILTWIADISNNTLPSKMLSSSQPTDINKGILKELYFDCSPADFVKPSGIEYLPYDLQEYENNNIIVAPTQDLERYIAYDYFKADNPPIENNVNTDLRLIISLDKYGVHLSFLGKKNIKYKLYKIESKEHILLSEHIGNGEIVNFDDLNVFKKDKIDYYLVDELGNSSQVYTVKPKEYLVNMLNNELLANKKKWYV